MRTPAPAPLALIRIRRGAYSVFEIVAWPAIVWSAFELAVRATLMGYQGLGEPSLILACAILTVIACRRMTASHALPVQP